MKVSVSRYDAMYCRGFFAMGRIEREGITELCWNNDMKPFSLKENCPYLKNLSVLTLAHVDDKGTDSIVYPKVHTLTLLQGVQFASPLKHIFPNLKNLTVNLNEQGHVDISGLSLQTLNVIQAYVHGFIFDQVEVIDSCIISGMDSLPGMLASICRKSRQLEIYRTGSAQEFFEHNFNFEARSVKIMAELLPEPEQLNSFFPMATKLIVFDLRNCVRVDKMDIMWLRNEQNLTFDGYDIEHLIIDQEPLNLSMINCSIGDITFKSHVTEPKFGSWVGTTVKQVLFEQGIDSSVECDKIQFFQQYHPSVNRTLTTQQDFTSVIAAKDVEKIHHLTIDNVLNDNYLQLRQIILQHPDIDMVTINCDVQIDALSFLSAETLILKDARYPMSKIMISFPKIQEIQINDSSIPEGIHFKGVNLLTLKVGKAQSLSLLDSTIETLIVGDIDKILFDGCKFGQTNFELSSNNIKYKNTDIVSSVLIE